MGWRKPRDTGDYSKMPDMTGTHQSPGSTYHLREPRVFLFVLEETFVTLRYAHCTVNQSAKAFHLPVLSGVPLCCRLWHSVTCVHKYIVCNAGKGTFNVHYHRSYQF